jgi:hypothetical protein
MTAQILLLVEYPLHSWPLLTGGSGRGTVSLASSQAVIFTAAQNKVTIA